VLCWTGFKERMRTWDIIATKSNDKRSGLYRQCAGTEKLGREVTRLRRRIYGSVQLSFATAWLQIAVFRQVHPALPGVGRLINALPTPLIGRTKVTLALVSKKGPRRIAPVMHSPQLQRGPCQASGCILIHRYAFLVEIGGNAPCFSATSLAGSKIYHNRGQTDVILFLP